MAIKMYELVHCLIEHDYNYTPILYKLHWLPVRQRIDFKILLITYISTNDMAPEYQCELVSIRKRLVLQPPLCGIRYQKCFVSRNCLILPKTHTCSRLLSQIKNKYLLNLL